MSDLQIGDVVFLKSGGPAMTITNIKGNFAAVKWFAEGGTLMTFCDDMHLNALVSKDG